MGKYEAKGTGLSAWTNRKTVYTVAIVVIAVALAGLIAFGVITREQITEFVDTLGWLIGILVGVVGLIAATLARNNVEPPTE